MVTSREDRRRARRPRAEEVFKTQAAAALDALALLDLAWHDCYGEASPPDQVVEDVWTVADGDLGRLVTAAHLAVLDRRDLRLDAEDSSRGRLTPLAQPDLGARTVGEARRTGRFLWASATPARVRTPPR